MRFSSGWTCSTTAIAFRFFSEKLVQNIWKDNYFCTLSRDRRVNRRVKVHEVKQVVPGFAGLDIDITDRWMRKKGCKYQQNDPRAVCADRNFIDRRIFWFTKGNIFCETCRGKMDSGWRRLRRTRWRFIDIENPCWLRVWWGGMRRGSNGGRKIIVIIWKIVNRVEKSVGSEMITVVCRPTDSYVVWRTLIETLTRFVCA